MPLSLRGGKHNYNQIKNTLLKVKDEQTKAVCQRRVMSTTPTAHQTIQKQMNVCSFANGKIVA